MTREEQIRITALEHCGDTYMKEIAYAMFCFGAKWADKTMFEKVCEWLKNSLYDTQDNCGYKVVASFDSVDVNEFIEDFKKAMEL